METNEILDLNDSQLSEVLREMQSDIEERHHAFIGNCAVGIIKYNGLTTPMRDYGRNLLIGLLVQTERAVLQEQAKDIPNLLGIYEIFTRASKRLKHPKITFQGDKMGKVRISLAGERSRYAGKLMVTNGGPFGDNEWYGHIDNAGAFIAGRSALSTERMDFLKEFSKDPVNMARRFAKNSGNCCFCNHSIGEREDQRSRILGYGPACAKSFSLPWGTKAARAVENGEEL